MFYSDQHSINTDKAIGGFIKDGLITSLINTNGDHLTPGKATITTRWFDDGEWHTAVFKKDGKKALVTVDGLTVSSTEQLYWYAQVNNSMRIGGIPQSMKQVALKDLVSTIHVHTINLMMVLERTSLS